MPVSIETVVFRPAVSRDLARLPRPEPVEGPPITPVEFSPHQRRELDALVEAVHCPHRRRLLLSLAGGGRANVTALQRRTGLAPFWPELQKNPRLFEPSPPCTDL